MKGADLMITKKEKTFCKFSHTIKKLNIAKLLRFSNIVKSCGVPAFQVFQFLLNFSLVCDHVSHRFVKGFTMLTLGWSDGYSFVPVAFNLLSSAEKKQSL